MCDKSIIDQSTFFYGNFIRATNFLWNIIGIITLLWLLISTMALSGMVWNSHVCNKVEARFSCIQFSFHACYYQSGSWLGWLWWMVYIFRCKPIGDALLLCFFYYSIHILKEFFVLRLLVIRFSHCRLACLTSFLLLITYAEG